MANTFNIYFGTESGNLALISSGQSDAYIGITANSLEYNTTYYWRVDSINEAEIVTTGDEWSFTTEVFAPPVPSGAGAANPNTMQSIRRLVVAAFNTIFYET